jgi:two-component system chemotaxis response regulator CheB
MEEGEINNKRFIVIGGSSGSLQVFIQIASKLPGDYPLPVLFIIHRANSMETMLPGLLMSKSRLPVKEVEEKEQIVPSRIYLAPADYHVLIEKDETFSMDYSEKLNYSRPSIDVSFMSAAGVFGKKLTGILLSGANEDGAEGLKTIKEMGGYTIIQDPEDAQVSYMPKRASLKSKIDAVLDTDGIIIYLYSLMPSADGE